jgi:hypothetical protein
MQKKGAALRAVQEQDTLADPGSSPGLRETGKEPASLAFTPVPRRYRHDGWTPERQVAFIHALADTGCVDRAARMVNMAQTNCYALRRAPGAEGFARAWEAALDYGLARLKDIAFERAIEGQLVPVFSQGKLMGYRRKRNDALLMFCLRHYGQDASGKRVTVNYFSTRAASTSSGQASAGAGAEGAPPPSRSESGTVPLPRKTGGGISQAEASTTTVRTVITGRGAGPSTGSGLSEAAAVLNGFEGVALDAEAEAAIARALEECAARARAAEAAYEKGGIAAADAAADDPGESFFRSDDYHGALIPPCLTEDYVPFVEAEPHWHLAGAEKPPALIAFEEEHAKKAGARGSGKEGKAPRPAAN